MASEKRGDRDVRLTEYSFKQIQIHIQIVFR